MVFLGEKFNFRDASCCRELVINGALGFLFLSFFVMFSRTNGVFSKSLRILSAASLLSISTFSSPIFKSFAWKSGFELPSRSRVIDQYSLDLNA